MSFDAREIHLEEACPSCNEKTLQMRLMAYHEKHSGDELLLTTIICETCGYKNVDVMPLAPSEHVRSKHYVLHVDLIDDLETKIFRAPTASIEIPEVEIVVEPGMAADLFITNVERILIKFIDACKLMLNSTSDENESGLLKEKIAMLDRMLRLELPFSIILDDPDGFSYIQPHRPDSLEWV